MSLQSSPSHEPIALPSPPPMVSKKKSPQSGMRRHLSNRKPPPRVESTQPRETSPELTTSSGEETAGEERFAVPDEGIWVNGAVAILPADDDKDWIDEDEDDEDLLELEYHPGYVSNVEKRRRRWEIGWENLTQAVCDLYMTFVDAGLIVVVISVVPNSRSTNGCNNDLTRSSLAFNQAIFI
jgi:hypothetical protein